MAAIDETNAENPAINRADEAPSPPPDHGSVTGAQESLATSPEPVDPDSLSTAQPESTQPETPVDPTVAVLQGMFPDFDASLLQSVLESVGGNQDKAIDILLGMSDPSYKSQVSHSSLTQTELDEQFARTLLLEESRQQPSWRPNESQEGVPYTPRRDAPHSRPGPDRQGEGDSMAQIQEQLGKFAETGKRTFNTLLSKVKAKIQEFDSPAGAQSQPSSHAQSHPLPHGDSWSTTAQSQTYYNPNPVVQGYEVQSTAAHVSSQPAAIPVHPSTVTTESPGTFQPPASSPPNAVDPAKIGLLPKRPVSLGSSPQPSRIADDDDDIEYVENPFEESQRH
ncbi:hypothetical protein M422DRAFT_777560 [Sphaerobolus stellatus SS14]|nr:hypothetical protein M422DRAFT_777560 [Sphaerobolus stellatus SS14]